jgi:hypothetical protein
MRSGWIAGIIFLVVSMALISGSITNESLIDTELENNLESVETAVKSVEDIGWDTPFTAVRAAFDYFDSLISIVWGAFNTPLWDAGGWAFIPYFTVTPIVAVIVFGLIITMIAIIQKQI